MVLAVAVAGAVGAMARHQVDEIVQARRPDSLLGIFAVNLLGSLLLGVLAGGVLFHDWSTAWTAVAGTGFCGGFTTFSTVSVASVLAAREADPRRGALNALGTLGTTVLAATIGLFLTSV